MLRYNTSIRRQIAHPVRAIRLARARIDTTRALAIRPVHFPTRVQGVSPCKVTEGRNNSAAGGC